MKTLELQLTDEIAAKIEQAAGDRGLSVGDLVRQSVEEKLARDIEFEAAAKVALEKNAGLYKRLA